MILKLAFADQVIDVALLVDAFADLQWVNAIELVGHVDGFINCQSHLLTLKL
jgi:hypothetical protein